MCWIPTSNDTLCFVLISPQKLLICSNHKMRLNVYKEFCYIERIVVIVNGIKYKQFRLHFNLKYFDSKCKHNFGMMPLQ